MILGPVHESNSCHTKHHETKDMSIMKIENHEQDVIHGMYPPYTNMCIYQLFQTNTIYECTIMHHHLRQAIISTMHQQAMTPQ
jgi:hypothetical protein